MSQTQVQALPVGGSLLMSYVDWETYTRLLRAFAERPGWKLTFDRGELEIMSPSISHDRKSRFFGRMITILTEELGLTFLEAGSTTMRRKKKRRGLEPDECFWITNAPALAGVEKLDLRVHPPPDLALEVIITNSALDRMAIYAALGVPEVWRLDGAALTFHLLTAGQYQIVTHSASFPLVTAADLLPFVQAGAVAASSNEVARQFRAWVRQHHGLANP